MKHWLRRCTRRQIELTTYCFSKLGLLISKQPLLILCLTSILALAASSCVINANFNNDIRSGITTPDSRASHEERIMWQFWRQLANSSSKAVPYASLLYAFPKSGANFLDADLLDSVITEFDHIVHNVSAADGATFVQLSGGTEKEVLELLRGIRDYLRFNTQLMYPFVDVLSYRIPVADVFQNVTYVNELSADSGSALISRSDALRIPIFALAKSQAHLVQLQQWELELYKYSTTVHYHSQFFLIEYGDIVVDAEAMKAGYILIPYFAVGCVGLLILVTSTVALSAYYFDQWHWTKLITALAVLGSPLLACSSGFGIMALAGTRFSGIAFLVPFLVLAIGGDDGFLMLHSWHKHVLPDWRKRLQNVITEVGPSITITSLTNGLAFLIGGLMAPSVDYRVFCFTTALCMVIDLIYQCCIFAPILGLLSKLAQRDTDDEEKVAEDAPRLRGIPRRFLNWLSCLMTGSVLWRLAAFAVLGIYLTISIWGAIIQKVDVSRIRSLVADSPTVLVDDLVTLVAADQYYPVTFVVNGPINFVNCPSTEESNSVRCPKTFRRFVRELERTHSGFGIDGTALWIDAYEKFLAPRNTTYYLQLLPEFLKAPHGALYKDKIIWRQSKGGRVVVNAFSFTCAFRGLADFELRAHVLRSWRSTVDAWRDNVGYNVSMYDSEAVFYEQILNNVRDTLEAIAITAATMVVICLVFIPSLLSVLIAMLAVASISIGIVGWLCWWGANLDQVVTVNIVMSIGFSVDYTAHVTHHYFSNSHTVARPQAESPPSGTENGHCKTNGDENGVGPRSTNHRPHSSNSNIAPTTPLQRVRSTLSSVALPMCQAGMSTIVCIAPSALTSGAAQLFTKTMFLVVLFGLIHGLLILPTAFAFIDFLQLWFQRRITGSVKENGVNGSEKLTKNDRDDIEMAPLNEANHSNGFVTID